ncbi:hypothetical protein AAFF_G00232990 [Aldrovandia affinis]|uniref:Proline and serine-rich protein 3 n=1 Tax=Aldrovandia affinis TaxID=143900 RepID=A0AAD7W3K5_9TELE|nr:hypothetical protein AAFF_G00232990 [Aldrovandia affinis]
MSNQYLNGINMKSSGAVFTRQSLFPPDPRLPRTHYNPSPTKKITKKLRKTNLSPVCPAKPPSLSQPQGEPVRLEDQRFLGTPVHPLSCTPPSKEPHPSFSESWPSTDHESSPMSSTASPSNEALACAVPSGKSQASSTPATQEDSVLAKYVERFRHGRPQSREERQRSVVTEKEWRPFWWLLPSSPPPSSSTTTTKPVQQGYATAHGDGWLSTSPVELTRHSPPLSPHGSPLDFTVTGLSDSPHCDPPDPEILQLQERASRLLQRSEHSLSSSSLPLSSEGLGCSDLSSPVSADEPVRRPVVANTIDPITGAVNPPALNTGPPSILPVGGLLAHRTRPEDDILFQWRLRRKMEQARQWPLAPSHGPALHQPQVNRQAQQAQQGIYTSDLTQRAAQHFPPVPQEPRFFRQPPASTEPLPLPIASATVSRLLPDTPVAAHMHFLCDVLPCPLQKPLPQRRRSPRKWEVPPRDHTHSPPNGQPSSTETSSEDLPSKESSSPPPPSSETVEEQWPVGGEKAGRQRKDMPQRAEPERTEKRTVPSCGKKKSTSHHRVGEGSWVDSHKRSSRSEGGVTREKAEKERVTQWPEESSRGEGDWERGQRSRREGRPGDQAPPPSPIHNALGQVISEVLFPTSDSPPHPRTTGSSDSPRYTPPAPPQSPAPATSVPQPPEVIAQLLQEAEDSDGLEFEDDPLLQVLRQQREWVKEQISEVDTILDEFQDN